MKTTRRDVLKFAGGSVVGVLFTPAPWRLITDTAIWSENWPGIPRPARGEIRTKYTHCSLCPAGCAVRARCVGERPVALAGVHGGLCPFGVAGHHLPYVRRTNGAAGAGARIAAEIAKCGPGERVAVLDLRPGRTASWTYRRAMAALKNGLYIAPARPAVAINLENARTVLSLGAPLLDGWIAPARAFAARERFRLIQAEPVESRTAALADVWMPVAPGSEDEVMRQVAGELHANGPALAIDSTMSPNVLAFNLELGAWGQTIVPRAEAPVPAGWKNAAPVTALADVPDHSIRVLLVDDAMPGEYVAADAIGRKLAPGAVPSSISSPVYPEALDDLPVAIDSPAPTFRLAVPLVPAAESVVSAADFVAALAGITATHALRERADTIHGAGRGKLITYGDAKTVPVKEVSADDFWNALNSGGCWIGDAPDPGQPPEIAPTAAPGRAGAAVLAPETAISSSPLLSKLYRESNLRLAPDQVAMHPSCGFADGAPAQLETGLGTRPVRILLDAGVRPGLMVSGARELAGMEAKVVSA